MRQRIISSVFFVAVLLGGVFAGAPPFYALFVLITLGSLWELANLLFTEERADLRPLRQLTMVVVGSIPIWLAGSTLWANPLPLLTILIAYAVLVFFLLIIELFLQSERPFAAVGAYLLGTIYVGVGFACFVQLAFWGNEYVPLRVFGIMLLVWTNDSMAYLVGSKIGRTPFFKRISPKKTWEGTLGGIVFALLIGWLLAQWVPAFTLTQWLIVAASAAIFGTIGDLVESMLKRSLGIKDSGNILPGHGGFLDRFDAFVFTMPFALAALLLLQ